MKRLLKWLLGGVMLLVGLVAVAALGLVLLVDPNDYREEIAAKVSQQTGREFRIDGDIAFSFFPWLGFEFGAMELGNAPGFGELPFARIASADARVKLLPLLKMQVQMDTVVLHGMTLRLQRSADGSSNWDDLVGAAESAPAATDKGTTTARSPEKLLAGLAINGIEVRDANVLWLDKQSGQQLELQHFALTSGAIRLDHPVPLALSGELALAQPKLAGTFEVSANVGVALSAERYRLDKLALKTDLSGALFPGGRLKAELHADAMADLKQQLAEVKGLQLRALGSRLAGDVNVTRLLQQPAVKGNITLQVEDGLAATAPIAASLPPGFKRGALNGATLVSTFQFDLGAQSLRLAPLNLALLGVDVKADVSGSAIMDAPRFQGELKSSEFVPRDVLSQLGVALPEMADPSTLTKAALSSRFDAGLDAVSLEQLVVQLDQSTLRGHASVGEFAKPLIRYDLQLDTIDVDRYLPPPSEPPAAQAPPQQQAVAAVPAALPLDLLRSLDVDGRLRVAKVKVMNLSSESIDATLKAKQGRFSLHPLGAKLYGGSYAGDLRLDVVTDTPKLAMDETLSGVHAGPLLKDFLGKDYVTGTATLAAKMNAEGVEPLAIRKSLNGNGTFRFDNGQITGLNIGQHIREAYALYQGQPKPAEELKQTDFSQLNGSFSVINGVVSTSDLQARSTLFQVAGKGSADLVKERLDMRLDTTVVSDIRDATGERSGDLTGAVIPVTIKGSFGEPKIGVDVASVLKAKAQSAIDKKKREVQQQLEQRKREEQQKLEQRKREEQQKLEQRKREEEAKAQQRLEEEKKRLQQELQDKFKNLLK